jgi:hypothetical protein
MTLGSRSLSRRRRGPGGGDHRPVRRRQAAARAATGGASQPPHRPAQARLWPDWRHHAFVTDVEPPAIEADRFYRDHATVELAIRDLKEGAGLEHSRRVASSPTPPGWPVQRWPTICCVGPLGSVTSIRVAADFARQDPLGFRPHLGGCSGPIGRTTIHVPAAPSEAVLDSRAEVRLVAADVDRSDHHGADQALTTRTTWPLASTRPDHDQTTRALARPEHSPSLRRPRPTGRWIEAKRGKKIARAFRRTVARLHALGGMTGVAGSGLDGRVRSTWTTRRDRRVNRDRGTAAELA